MSKKKILTRLLGFCECFQKSLRRRRRYNIAVPAGLVLSGLLVAGIILGATGERIRGDCYLPISQQDIIRARVVLDTGIYIQKLYDLDLQSKTFSADGYVWISWTGKLDAWDSKTKLDPADTLEFLNSVNKDSFSESLSPDKPYKDQQGRWYQAKAFSGRFLASDIDLRRFPFETIRLPIVIETDDFWIYEALMDASNEKGSGVSGMNSLNGYTYRTTQVAARKHVYNTAFGLTYDAAKAFGRKERSEYSSVIAEVVYSRTPRENLENPALPRDNRVVIEGQD